MLLPNARTYEERAEALDERASNLRNEADRLARRVADSAAAVGTGPPSDGLVRRYARVRKLAKRAERRADELWTKGTAFDSEIKTAERIGATAAAQQANATERDEPVRPWDDLPEAAHNNIRRQLSAQLGYRSPDALEVRQLAEAYTKEAHRINERQNRHFYAGEFTA